VGPQDEADSGQDPAAHSECSDRATFAYAPSQQQSSVNSQQSTAVDNRKMPARGMPRRSGTRA